MGIQIKPSDNQEPKTQRENIIHDEQWERFLDKKSGLYYYHDWISAKTSWDKPVGYQSSSDTKLHRDIYEKTFGINIGRSTYDENYLKQKNPENNKSQKKGDQKQVAAVTQTTMGLVGEWEDVESPENDDGAEFKGLGKRKK